MATQRAILVTEIGKPAIIVEDHPTPQPGPGQIQVKVTIAGLNPHDQKSRDWGLFIKDSLPAVLANDIVGIVSKLGDDNTGFAIGDRVVAQGGFSAGWQTQALQEYAIEDVAYTSKIPDGISDDDAATLPTNVIAGIIALFSALKITAPWLDASKAATYKDSSILIVGGGSNCGRLGVQLAKLVGFGSIIVVGGSPDELKDLGATGVIDRHIGEDKIVQQIRDIVGDELLYAYDAVNPPSGQTLAVKALSNTKKGALARLIRQGPPPGESIDPSILAAKGAGVDILDVLGLSSLAPQICGPFWKALPGYLESGHIRATPYTTVQGLTAENVNAILDAYRDGKRIDKTHIHF